MNEEKQPLPTGLALLRESFPEHQILELKKFGNGPTLKYVGHAALTDRLLDCDPNWTWEPMALDKDGLPKFDDIGGLWIKLTVCGIIRLGYGHAGAKKGGDAIKEIIGDALRNAAMRFGAALDLWHKGDLHADDEPEQGKSPEQAISNDSVLRENINKFMAEYPDLADELKALPEGSRLTTADREAIFGGLYDAEEICNLVTGLISARKNK